MLEQAEEVGGQLLAVHNPINNYLGLHAENGPALRERFVEQTSDCEFDLWTNVEIESADLKARRVTLKSGEQLQSIAIIIATGLRRRQLGIPGEMEFAGRGLIESGAHDRDQFAGKDVCVIGGGDAAAENALLLAEVCPTVTLVHRGRKLRARESLPKRSRRITASRCFRNQSCVASSVAIGSKLSRSNAPALIKPFQMAVQGVLIRIGFEPNTDLCQGQIELDERIVCHRGVTAGNEHCECVCYRRRGESRWRRRSRAQLAQERPPRR